MAIKMEALIKMAREQGIKIKFSHTTENGFNRFVVKSINGQSFSGKSGNTALRMMMGQSLSSAETASRAKGSAVVAKVASGVKKSKVKLPKDIKDTIKRLNAKLRRSGKTERSRVSQYKKTAERYGEERAREALTNSLLHANKIAYPATIDAKSTGSLLREPEYEEAVNWLRGLIIQKDGKYEYKRLSRVIFDEALQKGCQILYTYGRNTIWENYTPKQLARAVIQTIWRPGITSVDVAIRESKPRRKKRRR